ncbi:ComEC family competence protein [compost metagenome]
MRIYLLAFLLVSLSATPLRPSEQSPRLVVWNVSQGQWITYSNDESCWHFDVGGEFLRGSVLKRLCKNKINKVFLSHWDWDHIGLLPRLKKIKTPSCLGLRPLGSSSAKKEALLKDLPTCAPQTLSEAEVYSPLFKKGDSNSQSHVVLFKGFLIPGDSPVKEELLWIHQLRSLSKTRVLILGHHGSRTSSSEELLNKIPLIKMSVASARWSRYGHPHPKTLFRLAKHRIPLLRTEDWGHIVFEF